MIGRLCKLAALLLLMPIAARGGEYSSAGVGNTGLHLHNSASSGYGQYTSEEYALMSRFRALLCDVDILRRELAELNPELERQFAGNFGHSPDTSTELQPHTGLSGYSEVLALFALALRNNPKLKPLRSELAALAARTRMAGAPEDPMAMLEFMDWPASPPLPFNGLRDAGVSIGVSQEFASHGKRGLRKLVAGYDERIRQQELASAELALCWEIVQAYYDIAGSKAALRAMDRQIELTSILLELGEKRYALGLTPQAQVLDVQLRLGQMEAKRVEMHTMLIQQQQELSALMGYSAGFDPAALTYTCAYPEPSGLQLELDVILPQILDLHPESMRLELEIEQASWNTELARREFYPNYRLSVSYAVGRMMQDSVSANIEVPLLFNKEQRQDAGVQEAYAMVKVLQDKRAELPNELRRQLATLQSELDMHGELVRRYRSALVPQARLSTESMLAGYATGMMPLDEVIMALERALEVENESEQQSIHYLHVLADLHVATAGVFDPSPFMLASDSPLAGSGSGGSLNGLATVPPAEDGLLLPVVPPDNDRLGLHSESADQTAHGFTSFVDALELPESLPQPDHRDEEAGEAKFYTPFTPKGKEKE